MLQARPVFSKPLDGSPLLGYTFQTLMQRVETPSPAKQFNFRQLIASIQQSETSDSSSQQNRLPEASSRRANQLPGYDSPLSKTVLNALQPQKGRISVSFRHTKNEVILQLGAISNLRCPGGVNVFVKVEVTGVEDDVRDNWLTHPVPVGDNGRAAVSHTIHIPKLLPVSEERRQRLVISVFSTHGDAHESRRPLVTGITRTPTYPRVKLIGCFSICWKRLAWHRQRIRGDFFLLSSEVGREKLLRVNENPKNKSNARSEPKYEQNEIRLRRGGDSETFGFRLVGSGPAVVSKVLPGSLAGHAGIKTKDIIERVGATTALELGAKAVASLIRRESNKHEGREAFSIHVLRKRRPSALEDSRQTVTADPKPVTSGDDADVETSFGTDRKCEGSSRHNSADTSKWYTQLKDIATSIINSKLENKAELSMTSPQYDHSLDNQTNEQFCSSDEPANSDVASNVTSGLMPTATSGVLVDLLRAEDLFVLSVSYGLEQSAELDSNTAVPLRNLFICLKKLKRVSKELGERLHEACTRPSNTSLQDHCCCVACIAGSVYSIHLEKLCELHGRYSVLLKEAERNLKLDVPRLHSSEANDDAISLELESLLYLPVQHLNDVCSVMFALTPCHTNDLFISTVKGLQELESRVNKKVNLKLHMTRSLLSVPDQSHYTSDYPSPSLYRTRLPRPCPSPRVMSVCHTPTNATCPHVHRVQRQLTIPANVREFQLSQPGRWLLHEEKCKEYLADGALSSTNTLLLFNDCLLLASDYIDGGVRRLAATYEPIALAEIHSLDAPPHCGDLAVLLMPDASGNLPHFIMLQASSQTRRDVLKQELVRAISEHLRST